LLEGGASTTGAYEYNRAFSGTYISLGASGTVTFNGTENTTRPLFGRQIYVYYWSETGGGTFKVQTNSLTAPGTYTDLVPDNAGTAIGTTGGSATIGAAEGGATGALRVQTYTLPTCEFVNIRTTGLSGSAKIVAAGIVEVPDQLSSRITGYSEINCAAAGSQPSQWDDITDPALTTLLNTWDPSVVFFRGYETLSQWQNEWTTFVARIRAIKPSIEVVVIGMHNTGDNQHNTLDSTDAYLQTWCDNNNGVFIPIRNRLGTFRQNLATGIYGNPQSAIKTITAGSSGTGIITVNPSINVGTDGYAVGGYVRLTSLTGGSGLTTNKSYEPYRILEIPTSTTLKLALYDGTTPATFSTNITAGTMDLYDTTHPSSDGVRVIDSLISESYSAASEHDITMRGQIRKFITPQYIQTADEHSSFLIAGPSNKWKTIDFSRVDGFQSEVAYPPIATLGAKQNGGNEVGIITGPNRAGWGMAWDANYCVMGGNPANFTRPLNDTFAGVGDATEIYSGNAGLITLALSKPGTSESDAPFLVGRDGASSSSKGTNDRFLISATGRAKFNVPTYANDAAADADATLLSGMLYRTTAGGRAVFQKP
jgi:hypothetical protein